MGGNAVQVFADFDDMAWNFSVPSTITQVALVGRDMTIRKALVQPDGALSVPGAFANDDFAIRLQNAFVGPFTVENRTNIGYSGEPGEVDCVYGEVPPFMASAWYLFTPTTTANHDLTTNTTLGETDFDTTLAIYLDAPTLGAVMAAGSLACDDDGGLGATSFISNVPLTAGVPYAVRVDGYGGDQGIYGLEVYLS